MVLLEARLRSPSSVLSDEKVKGPGALNLSLYNCLFARETAAPPHGNCMSHSLRIWLHTEQILLLIPLEVRLAKFEWPRSQEMASLYSERTISLSTASFWIFGQPISSPVAAASINFM